MNRRFFLSSGIILGAAALLSQSPFPFALGQNGSPDALPFKKIVRSETEWKRMLTPEQYHVIREKGTEAPYTSPLNKVYQAGTYQCTACALPLFSSKTKFDSQTGWPSFWAPIAKQNVREESDTSIGESRVEVLCARCDAHLGHVFNDGPEPTGLRYCMNGLSLKFVKKR